MQFKNFEIIPIQEDIKKEMIEKVISTIEKIQKNNEDLGAGRAGKVYAFPEDTFCIKEIVDKSWEYSFNDIHTENEMQQRAISIGVNSPQIIMSISSDKGESYLIMQKINGVSLKDINEKGIQPPVNIDENIFWNELKSMIKNMNSGKVYHRDLHEGNIMIDYETLKPVIIDYGHAIIGHGDENPFMENNYPKIGEVTRFVEDTKRVDEIENRMLGKLTK